MKLRQGFVSNSSSSSFILIMDSKPKTKKDVIKFLFGDLYDKRESILNRWQNKWDKESLEKEVIGWLKTNNKKNGDYLWPLRVSLTGLKNSPGPFEVAAALGKNESIHRLEKALK